MKKLLLVSLFVMCSTPAWAQDMDAMVKWTEAKVIHYRVVGEFSSTMNILSGRDKAPVTDRVEIEFDWNQEENKLVGTPVIRNFPTKMGPIVPLLDCPAPKVSGAFEFTTVLSLKDQADATLRMAAPGVIMASRRDNPTGEAPLLPDSASRSCGATWEKVAAKSVTTSDVFGIPLAMMLAMGQAGGEKITPDGKSIIVEHDAGAIRAQEGWTWTFTPTIVK